MFRTQLSGNLLEACAELWARSRMCSLCSRSEARVFGMTPPQGVSQGRCAVVHHGERAGSWAENDDPQPATGL